MGGLIQTYRTGGALSGGGGGGGRIGPIVWALSSQWDFSAVGLQEGDYGLLVLSGGPVLLRYKVVTIAAGAGGGTVPMWIPPAAYGQTGLEVDCYADGDEDDAELSTQGLAPTELNTGTVSPVDSYIRLDAPAVGSGNSVAQLTAPTLTGAAKWWLTCEVRGATAGNASCGFFGPTSELATQWAFAAQIPVNSYVQNLFQTTAGSWAAAFGSAGIRGGGSLWPATTPWTLHVLTGSAISDCIETLVDGTPYQAVRRNADGATAGSNFTLTPLAVGGVGVSCRLEFRRLYRLKWS